MECQNCGFSVDMFNITGNSVAMNFIGIIGITNKDKNEIFITHLTKEEYINYKTKTSENIINRFKQVVNRKNLIFIKREVNESNKLYSPCPTCGSEMRKTNEISLEEYSLKGLIHTIGTYQIKPYKFGYILSENLDLIDTFRNNSKRQKELELLINQVFENYQKKERIEIETNENFKQLIQKRIEYYLSLRNNEKPDYGINWDENFLGRNNMFIKLKVLGIEMELFQGNEDHIISFLARIHNYLIENRNLNLLFTDKIWEQKKIKTVANTV